MECNGFSHCNQILEQLAQTGNPSRAEISDAAMSERAECVMLNNGPYINKAVTALDNILRRMADHHYKKNGSPAVAPFLASRYTNRLTSDRLDSRGVSVDHCLVIV
jgi:uncharacterized protein YcbK (DUF882 family)